MNLQLKNLTLAQKLAALSLIFMAPILLLSWLLVAQSRKDIDFAALEMDGSHYLATSVWPILHDLIGTSVNPDSGITTSGTAGMKALQGNQAAHDETMKSGEASAALREAYDKAVAGHSEDAYVDATAQARTLTGKVADGSNLTLDPDLDSYYMQDLVTVKLPEFIDQAATLLRMAHSYGKKTALTTQEKADFLIHAGQFAAVYNGVKGDIDSAGGGNPDGTIKPAMEAPTAALVTVADEYMKAAGELGRAFSEGDPSKANLKELEKLHKAVHAEANTLYGAGIAQLDRLLQTRIDGFTQKLTVSLAVTFVLVLLAVFFSRRIARSILAAINKLVGGIDQIAEGGLNVQIPFLERHDEISMIARALERFRDKTVEKSKLAAERQQAEMRQGEAHTLNAMANELQNAVGDAMTRLVAAVQVIKQSTGTVIGTAQETQHQVSSVNSQTEIAASNIDTVASAAVELTAAIGEISGNVANAAQISQRALNRTEKTREQVKHLADTADKIGAVVTLINDIAAQTNLLALNATIEAARAGDAGKGFAVVAGEVKNLAMQTAKATEDIKAQVDEIQSATQDAVSSINTIADTVSEVTQVSTAISTAIEEQSAATNEISRSIELASDSTKVVVKGVGSLGGVVANSEKTALAMETATKELTQQSGVLRDSLDNFIRRIQRA